jgi:hypothetical protein
MTLHALVRVMREHLLAGVCDFQNDPLSKIDYQYLIKQYPIPAAFAR